MPSRSLTVTATLAAVFFAFHLPYLPASLEDVDSINFALGMHRFDVADHQPHPPGYPLFVAAARAMHLVVTPEARALAAVSIVSGALGVVAIVALFRRMDGGYDAGIWPQVGALMTMTAPLYWFTAARPLSDLMGLAAALGVQALLLAAETRAAMAAASCLAGLAIGIRSQVFWLTVPLLMVRTIGRLKPRAAGDANGHEQDLIWTATGFAIGVLVWLVPLVALAGGPNAYWQALFAQGSEDFSGIRMLWTTPTPRALLDALYYAFVAPWGAPALAVAVLVLATIGAFGLARRGRAALGLLLVAFGPYFVFDVLFQETFTSRYALPLVVPVAFLAMTAVRAVPAPLALAAMAPVVMYGAHIGGTSIAAYARVPAPAFAALADMRRAADGRSVRPVFAPDRRQSFDLRRVLAWSAPEAPVFDRTLASPPQHEWLEAARYWSAGGRARLWFVVDPRRAMIDFVEHGEPRRYRRPLPYPVLDSGTRPGDVDWYDLASPDWYVDEGWSLTPELAGIAGVDRRGLAFAPIAGHVRAAALSEATIVIGGRNFEPSAHPRMIVAIGDLWRETIELSPGPFLRVVRLPIYQLDESLPDYLPLTVSVDPPSNVAVEQFDVAPPLRETRGFGAGWEEPEFSPQTGQRWRWLSGRGEIRYTAPPGGAWLRIAGESPLKYYRGPSKLVIRAGDRTLRETVASDDFDFELRVPAAFDPATIVVETDQTFVPADKIWPRTADRRTLGLRVYACELRPLTASAPGRAASFPPVR